MSLHGKALLLKYIIILMAMLVTNSMIDETAILIMFGVAFFIIDGSSYDRILKIGYFC